MTIIELMIVCAILMIVLLATLSSFESVSKAQAYQADRTKSLDEMRSVLNRMTKDLRQASTLNEAASTASSVTFTTAVNGVSTQIVYTASGTTLTRQVGSGTAFPALKHLASTNIFTYVSAGGVTGIQWVEMNLQVTPALLPNSTLVPDSEVNLRNRTSALTGAS